MTIGIDEVGRGCWAGPLLAAAVELPLEHGITGLTDSKILSPAKRQKLATEIKKLATQFCVGWVWPEEINQLGLTESVRTAMQRAVDGLDVVGQSIVIDGNYNYLAHLSDASALVKADLLVESVSAASILAKVERDQYMQKVADAHPEYGFESHVGYGTAKHLKALQEHGIINNIHRLNYKPIKRFIS